MSNKDQEPAFPGADNFNGPKGMSLRDYFASTADLGRTEFATIQHICDFVGEENVPESMDGMMLLAAKAAAKLRYVFADAMLAERDK